MINMEHMMILKPISMVSWLEPILDIPFSRQTTHPPLAMINLRLISHTLALVVLISLANLGLLLALLVKPFKEAWSWSIACGTAYVPLSITFSSHTDHHRSEWFWSYMQHHWETSLNAAAALQITGDAIPAHEPALVISVRSVRLHLRRLIPRTTSPTETTISSKRWRSGRGCLASVAISRKSSWYGKSPCLAGPSGPWVSVGVGKEEVADPSSIDAYAAC